MPKINLNILDPYFCNFSPPIRIREIPLTGKNPSCNTQARTAFVRAPEVQASSRGVRGHSHPENFEFTLLKLLEIR